MQPRISGWASVLAVPSRHGGPRRVQLELATLPAKDESRAGQLRYPDERRHSWAKARRRLASD